MMASQPEPEIILYDLACIKNVCFSPVVWRIRLILNYKQIPYKTIFLEFPDIEPTLKGLNIPPSAPNVSKIPYTVPTIHHLPTNTYVMESNAIAIFLEKHYPNPPLSLSSPLGDEIISFNRTILAKPFFISTAPREPFVLPPRSAAYFRRTREASLGMPIDDLLKPEGKEERVWGEVKEALNQVGEMMTRNKDKGPFILGEEPCMADFFVAGSLQNAKVVDEDGVWKRMMSNEAFRGIYEACEKWMERKD